MVLFGGLSCNTVGSRGAAIVAMCRYDGVMGLDCKDTNTLLRFDSRHLSDLWNGEKVTLGVIYIGNYVFKLTFNNRPSQNKICLNRKLAITATETQLFRVATSTF